MTEKYWPISELVALRLPGYPVTRQGWDTLVKREVWLNSPLTRAARLTPSIPGKRNKTMVGPMDPRATLTADEINLAARSMAAGLEGYLISALSHPANEGLQAKGSHHGQA